MTVTVYGGATVNGVQRDTEVILARKGYDKWPKVMDGLNQWESKVKAMDLVDHKVPIRELRMNPETGGFYRETKNPNKGIPATRTAIGHLLSYVKDKPSNTLGVMLDLPPAIRAQVFHNYMQRPEVRDIILRTGMSLETETRVIRAAVTEIHSQEKGDDLSVIANLKSIFQSIPTALMRVQRMWDITNAEIIIPNVGVQPKVGVTLYGRIQITNSETKGGSYQTFGGSMNLVCLNGMTRMVDSSEYRVRHMGDIGFKVRMSIKGALEAVTEHLDVFGRAYNQTLPATRSETLERIERQYKLPSETISAMNVLWDVDGERGGGLTLAGLVNAATRHAQSLAVDSGLELEGIAGQILHKGLEGL